MNNAKSLTRKWKTPLQIVIEVIMPYINWNCSNRKWNIGMFCLGRHAQTYLRWIHTPGPRVKTIPEFQSVGPGGPRAKESTWKMNPWKRHFFPLFSTCVKLASSKARFLCPRTSSYNTEICCPLKSRSLRDHTENACIFYSASFLSYRSF